MALPTTGITTSMVAAAIGEGSNDVGTLCSSNKINKWSKWKPVRSNNHSGLLLTDLQNLNFGFTIPSYTSEGAITSPGSFLYNLKNHIVGWTYNKPSGGSTSPYRIGDFRGYEHTAIQPVSVPSSKNVFLQAPTNWFRLFLNMDISPGNTSNVALEDFYYNTTSFSDFYLGVMLNQYDNYYATTAANTLGYGDYYVQFDDMSGAIGDWTASYFLLSYYKGKNDAWQTGVYIPIDIQQTALSIKPAGMEIYANPYGQWDNSDYDTVTYTIQVINQTDSALDSGEVESYLVYTTGTQEPKDGTVVASDAWGTYNVPANSIENITGGIFFHTRVTDRIYWLGAKTANSPITYNQVEDPFV